MGGPEQSPIASEQSPIAWHRSTASNVGNCVEVARSGGSVLVRHSRQPAGPLLKFTAAEWEAFLAGARGGEFDLSALAWGTGQQDGRTG